MFRKAALAVTMGLAAMACDKPAATTAPAEMPAGTAATAAVTGGGDSQVLANITAVNAGEVEQANTALPKLTNSDAKEFATMMQKQHTDALAKISSVATEERLSPVENATTGQLKAKSSEVVSKLSAEAAGNAYDRTYMQAQVDGHTSALKLIDSELLPNITDAKLKDTIAELRGHVEHHLTKAQSVLQSLPTG